MTSTLLNVALERLNRLIEEGWNRGLPDTSTASLATADTSARPSVRTIDIVAIEADGLVFFANVNSGKSRQLLANPRASLCFFWRLLQEQVIVEGAVILEGENQSDEYWKKVPRDKQVFTSVTAESSLSTQSGSLTEMVTDRWPRFGFDPVDRPNDWRAFRLIPDRIEFWPSGWRRAKERVHYSKTNDGEWCHELVNF